MRSANGVFADIPCYFYAVKIKSGAIVYFISLYQIDQNKLLDLYKIRWNIELYHRTAKQSLGWKDCQMRSSNKQLLHSLYVMYAYAIAESTRIKLQLATTEDAIRRIPVAKSENLVNRFSAIGENLC